jgi:KDO2-lipid IV(A) lauroyltransferase
MRFIIYVITYPLLWCFSKMPFPILYLFSDFIYLIVYYGIGYRKKTVRENLALALPNLSARERLTIEKKFFRHLCDIFLEMIKTMTISKKEINRRFVFTNLEVYKNLEGKQKSIAIMMAHYASYEWAVSINSFVDFEAYGIYKKIANPYFDKLVRNIRLKFKAKLITTKETIPTIIKNNKVNKLCTYGFASDQSPKLDSTFHWQKFMGIEVPVHIGAEMLSKKYNMNVIFIKIKKIKRGYYEASFEVLSENVSQVPKFEITNRFMQLVEQQIYEAPEYYLWTHKRWKHQR